MKGLQKITKKAWVALPLVVVMIATLIIVPGLGTHAGGYDPQQAVAYAEQWSGSKRNPDYRSYSGADCMNYVSQCLRAGGLETGSDWQPYTASWVGCVSFVNAMRARGYQVIENPSADQIYPGNPVLFQWKGSSYEWSHATICVGYDGNGTPIVNGHTRDREHVRWNYGASSASRMCTVLINDGYSNNGMSISQLGSPVDIGSEFYAYIYNDMSGKVITNDIDNVSIRTQGNSIGEIRRQVWRFVRQSDNSYFIYSCSNDKALDVEGAVDNPGVNVQVYNFWGENNTAQRWEIYAKDGAYVLRPQVSGSCLLDIANANREEGTNVQIATINGSPAQSFQIRMVDAPAQEQVEEPTTEQVEEPTTEQVEEPTTEQVEEPTTEQVEEPTTEQVEEPTTEQVEESTTEQVEEPTTEQVEEPTTEQVEEPTTEQTEEPDIAGNTNINVTVDNSTNNTFITFIYSILGIEDETYDMTGGSDNTDWSRDEAQKRYDAGLQEGYEPVTVAEESTAAEELAAAEEPTVAEDTQEIDKQTEIRMGESTENIDTAEAVDGIRFITSLDESGRLKNLYLQIVIPVNGTKQVYRIQLI